MYARMQIELQRNPMKNTTKKPDTPGNRRLFGATDTQNNTTRLGNGIIASRSDIDPRIKAAYTPMNRIDFFSMTYEQQLEYKQWQIKAVLADRRRILRPPLPDFVKFKLENLA